MSYIAVLVLMYLSCASSQLSEVAKCQNSCQSVSQFYYGLLRNDTLVQKYLSTCLLRCPILITSTRTATSSSPSVVVTSPVRVTSTTINTTTRDLTTATTTPTSAGNFSCGKPFRIRIVNGNKAEECEFPWMAALYHDGLFICGASILDARHLLTAAHCFTDKGRTPISSSYKVSVGSSSRAKMTSYSIQQISYDSRYLVSPNNDYDVAVITLSESLKLNNCTAPICLPQPGEDAADASYCMSAGWGISSYFKQDITIDLMKVVLPIVSYSNCSQSYNGISDLKLCAGDYDLGSVDTCKGDSGGPLMCLKNGRFVAQGIVSFGKICGQQRQPGVYTNVSHPSIMEFIQSNLLS